MDQKNELKIVNQKIIRGKIIVQTGLLIGGPEGPMKIGGVDKEPINIEGKPYIPGSSLKGKMRAVLSYKYGERNEEINHLFGSSKEKGESSKEKSESSEEKSESSEEKSEYAASRIIVRDCFLSEEWKNKPISELYEIKMENTIDKKTGKTKGGGLRTFKRVKPGVCFDFEIIINELNDGKLTIERAEKLVKESFELIENSYLGGSGSRGYGKVKIEIS
ncbi:MAG: type III-A CRISPR-associated RAMP protein Csm3 [Candidatus Anstonellaceae archaeon]